MLSDDLINLARQVRHLTGPDGELHLKAGAASALADTLQDLAMSVHSLETHAYSRQLASEPPVDAGENVVPFPGRDGPPAPGGAA